MSPQIVVNVGGATLHEPLPVSQIPSYYSRLENCLTELDCDGFELTPQTMPPFPWHFGGQSNHNLGMDPYEISGICQKNKMRLLSLRFGKDIRTGVKGFGSH
jgi:hypothetical protein